MLGTCTLNLARSASLREAADVLRTDRRTERDDGTAQVNTKACVELQLSKLMRQSARRSEDRQERRMVPIFLGGRSIFIQFCTQ